MNCRTARQTLELARPDELEPKGLDDAARHVDQCPACQRAVRRQNALDARIGVVCRDVPIPSGLQQRLLEGLAAADAGPELQTWGDEITLALAGNRPAESSVSAPTATPAAKRPIQPARRRWLLMLSTSAAVVLVIGLSAFWLLPSPPTVNLDTVSQWLADGLDPDELGPFVRFANGAAAELPTTMDTRPLRREPRRLPGAEIGAKTDVAVYFFTVSSSPGRPPYQGRLAVVPVRSVINPPGSARFLGVQPIYRGAFVTSAWVEGNFVYLCCLENAQSLERLQPQSSAI